MSAGSGTPSIFDRFQVDTKKKYGEGGYGQTFAAKDKQTGEALACKIIDTRKMKAEAIQKECHILEVLTHANVISVKGHGLGFDRHAHLYFIFMELAGGGELFDQVIDRGANAMPEAVARNFFCQMLDGLAYCHLAGVAHRDLKLENVLLNEAGAIKLIDFGLSHVYPRGPDGAVDRSKPLKDVCGSRSYAAPEVFAGNGYDGFAADMWSIGVCLFAMLSGFFPLDEATGQDWRFPKLATAQRSNVSTTAVVYSWYKRSSKHLSPEVVHLLDNLLAIDPRKRLTMADTREHPWVTGTKFGGVAAGSDGAYNASTEISDEPTYRGISGAGYGGGEDVVMDEDEMPVYRSLNSMAPPDEAAHEATLPGLKRQKAALDLFNVQAAEESLDLAGMFA